MNEEGLIKDSFLTLTFQVETKDALLHAINEEYVEAVEVLLEHEEGIHKEGEPHVSFLLPYKAEVYSIDDVKGSVPILF